MKKIFLDTNIILDYIDARKEFMDDAVKILCLAERNDMRLYASALSFSNIAYILRKYSLPTLKETFSCLCDIIDVLPVDNSVLQKAIKSPFTDFEDAMQYYCAENGGCGYIITRNVKDFDVNDDYLKVMTPKHFLEEIDKDK